MHNKIDCIDTGDGSHHHITRVTEEVGEVVGIFGAPTVLTRVIMNKYMSDFIHNRIKKNAWVIKVY